MLEIAARLQASLAVQSRISVTTVVAVHGTAPRTVGTSMALDSSGRVLGSISGGCVEAAVFEACTRVLETGQAEVEHFGFSDETAFEVGLSCGGELDVIVHMLDSAYIRAEIDAAAAGRSAGLVTVVGGPSELLGTGFALVEGAEASGQLEPAQLIAAGIDDVSFDRLRAAASSYLQSGRSGVIRVECGTTTLELFCETSLTPPRMLLFGAVEFAAALADAASLIGYRVTVCDARSTFATPERFPGAAEVVVDWPHRYLNSTEVDERTVICVLSHDAKFDIPLLQAALELPVAYIGALGSRSTNQRRRELLGEIGVSESALSLLHSPLGLDIGASTPEETAVSILAEILAERTGSTGKPLRELSGPIHRPAAVIASTVPAT